MAWLDWLVIGAYFVGLLAIAWWVILKRKDTADDYFLAGRNLGWWIVGASIFASNIGSEHLVGLAGSGCTDGVAMAHYELHAWCLLVLAWVFVPFYARSKVFTMPEFLERRFSPTARWVLSIISLVAYVLTKIAVGIYAGGVVFRTLLPDVELELSWVTIDSFWIGSGLVIILTGLYTVLGGLRAVAYTEAVQTIVLVVGSALVTLFGLKALGGWQELRKAPYPGTTANYNEGFNLWKPLVPRGVKGTWEPVMIRGEMIEFHCPHCHRLVRTSQGPGERLVCRQCGAETFVPIPGGPDPGAESPALQVRRLTNAVIEQAWYFKGEGNNYPWLGMLFCAPIIGLWYWCTDQYIVQRALGAPNEQQARRGSICASFLKLLPVFIFIIPGMICFALAASNKVPALRQELFAGGQLDAEKAQAAFPLMVRDVLPAGVRGIVVAGLLAALMSSLSGVFNASSTLFTMDFYSKLRPAVSQHQLVWMGRTATTAMVVIGLLWIPVIQNARGLYDYLQTVQAYLAPPIFVVFFLGVFWKRLNSKGCLAALTVGFVLALFRLAVDTPVALKETAFVQHLLGDFTGYREGSLLWIVHNIYFQYYSLLVFLVSVVVMVVVSLLSAPPDEERIYGLTYGTISAAHRAESRASWDWRDVAASAVVLLAILAAYLYFNG